MAYLKRETEASSDTHVHDVHTILGPESNFEGKLVFEGTVRVDGHFKGEVSTHDNLVIGQGAKVEADLSVGHVVIHGEVIGDITARHAVEIHAPARVRGNISTPQLLIDKGVVFEGSCKMEHAQVNEGVSPGGKTIALVAGQKIEKG